MRLQSSEDAMGGKRRGEENLTNDTPPKKGFWTPPSYGTFSTPLSGVSALFFLYKNPRLSRPEALLEGSKNLRESAFSGTFSSPHAVCPPPPPYHGPILEKGGNRQGVRLQYLPQRPHLKPVRKFPSRELK